MATRRGPPSIQIKSIGDCDPRQRRRRPRIYRTDLDDTSQFREAASPTSSCDRPCCVPPRCWRHPSAPTTKSHSRPGRRRSFGKHPPRVPTSWSSLRTISVTSTRRPMATPTRGRPISRGSRRAELRSIRPLSPRRPVRQAAARTRRLILCTSAQARIDVASFDRSRRSADRQQLLPASGGGPL